jgi:CRISPR/Cas system type I-B associated protein Csh2 (Cas7 group RAMP superfamily)
MINVTNIGMDKGNAYVLFGFEAIQARPNLDPYTSTLRMNDETRQVYTSDVHIKHHARRGMKAFAAETGIAEPEAAIFYEKEDGLNHV